MVKAYLGLGSNIGDTKLNLDTAVEILRKNERITVTKVSSYYKTEPVGYTEQEWFLNIVAEIETELLPSELLDYCQYIEQELKRVRVIRWGPRTIDVDVLIYDDIKMSEEKLTIPHPRMKERNFVIVPLMEINPELIIDGEKISDIYQRMEDKSEVIKES